MCREVGGVEKRGREAAGERFYRLCGASSRIFYSVRQPSHTGKWTHRLELGPTVGKPSSPATMNSSTATSLVSPPFNVSRQHPLMHSLTTLTGICTHASSPLVQVRLPRLAVCVCHFLLCLRRYLYPVAHIKHNRHLRSSSPPKHIWARTRLDMVQMMIFVAYE